METYHRSTVPSIVELRTLFKTSDSTREYRAQSLHVALQFIEDPAEALEEANRILDGSGVLYLAVPEGQAHPNKSAAYVNLGETYQSTIVFDDHAQSFAVQSWGDWFEGAEEEYQEESGEARCGYCGEWGDGEERSTCCTSFHLCQSCGRCSSCGSKPEPTEEKA